MHVSDPFSPETASRPARLPAPVPRGPVRQGSNEAVGMGGVPQPPPVPAEVMNGSVSRCLALRWVGLVGLRFGERVQERGRESLRVGRAVSSKPVTSVPILADPGLPHWDSRLGGLHLPSWGILGTP